MRRLVAVGLVLVVSACARNPVTGKRELSLVSQEQEIALGQQAAQDVEKSIGLYPDPKAQAYVERLGKALAAKSERPDLPWRFGVVDDPSVNAFALPGGAIFVTRGIMTHLNNEAELVAVLGHEVGHVAAKHSVEQLSKATLAQVGLGVGALIRPDLARYAQVAGAGLGLLFLKFGRDAERQADDLGFRYGTQTGHDMRQMPQVFKTLGRVSQAASERGKLPEWLSTHPDPENRVTASSERVAAANVDWSRTKVERDAYLAVVNGMTYGEDPRQGYFQGNAFLHPGLKFRMDMPAGWKTQNTPQAVAAVSPSQDAVVQLQVAGAMTPEQAAQKFYSQQGIQQATGVNLAGLPPNSSYFQAQTEQGVVAGLTSFFSHGGQTFMIASYSGQEQLGKYDPAFRATVTSFAPLTDPAALAVQPAKVELVKVPRDMTLAQFHAESPSSVTADELALINGLERDSPVKAGTTLKRVVGGVKK